MSVLVFRVVAMMILDRLRMTLLHPDGSPTDHVHACRGLLGRPVTPLGEPATEPVQLHGTGTSDRPWSLPDEYSPAALGWTTLVLTPIVTEGAEHHGHVVLWEGAEPVEASMKDIDRLDGYQATVANVPEELAGWASGHAARPGAVFALESWIYTGLDQDNEPSYAYHTLYRLDRLAVTVERNEHIDEMATGLTFRATNFPQGRMYEFVANAFPPDIAGPPLALA